MGVSESSKPMMMICSPRRMRWAAAPLIWMVPELRSPAMV